MKKVQIYHKNRMPHIRPIGATFFITMRLGDSLPQHIVREMKMEFERKKAEIILDHPDDHKHLIYNEQKRFFAKYDHQLDDKPYGECYLQQPEAAKAIIDELERLDGEYFDLQAYCIMPNHLHLLVDTSIQLHGKDVDESNLDEHYTQLNIILKKFKGRSARYANQAIGRSGNFWQKDSYDHYVRDEKEWNNIANYILDNPVKAGLAKQQSDWQYSYYKYSETGD